MPRGKGKKNPFEDLDTDYKTNVESMTDDEIRQQISKVAMNEVDNQRAKKDDQDLADKKLAAKMAGEQYSDATKMNKLRIEYAKQILEARGKA